MSGLIVTDDGYASVDDGQRHPQAPVKLRVNDGFAVFAGQQHVTSGTVTVEDAALAERLLASGAAEEVKDKARARKG